MTENELSKVVQDIKLSAGEVGESVNFDDQSMIVNDGSQIFHKGDQFTIPKEWGKVKFAQYFGAEAHRAQHLSRPAKGILVECQDGSIKKLFIGTLKKSAMQYDRETSERVKDSDGNVLPNVTAGGTAVKAFLACKTVEDGFNALAGKQCEVTACHEVTTMGQIVGGRGIRTTYVYDIDLVK